MTPRSNTLFHFTRSIDVLKLILKGGFWPRYCIEDTHWHRAEVATSLAYPMVCFCDIPISRIADHIAFYGAFGVGLSKEWALKNQLNPVTYLASDSPLREAMSNGVALALWVNEERRPVVARLIRMLYSYVKPLSGRMTVSGTVVEKDFYQESEWRYVPQHTGIEQHLNPDVFNSAAALEKHNERTRESCMLTFLPSDVRYIFVPSDSDIPTIIDFLQVSLGDTNGGDLQVLMSRVTSLESLQRDL